MSLYKKIRVQGVSDIFVLDSSSSDASGYVNVELFRQPGFTDYQTAQAALDSGFPLLWPQRTYTMNSGETLINTKCHAMLGADCTWFLGNNSTVNTDSDWSNFTPFMQIEGVQGFTMFGKFTVDGNRDNQTYPATINNFGRGVTTQSSTGTLNAVGRRTNASVIFCCGDDNLTPTRHVRLCGEITVQNGYLNGLCFWQTEDVVVDGLFTTNNTINGVSLGGVKGFRAINCFHYRDGVSSVYTSTRSDGDRAGIQAREMPFGYTSNIIDMPAIPVPVSNTNEPNYDVSIIGCAADECQAEGWFLRMCFPGRISNCYAKNIGYQRLAGASFNPAPFWCEGGWYQQNDNVAYQSTDNAGQGWMNPDVLVCQTFQGTGAGSTGGAPINISGNFKSAINNVRAVSGNDSSGNPLYHFNRGLRVYSACSVTSYYVQGTNAEGVRIENDTNFNLLPPHDVQLINGELSDVAAAFAVEVNRFGGGSVMGTADNLIIDGLIVRGMTTALVGTDDHAIIDFNTTMSGYATHGLTIVGLDIDGTNPGSAQVYNGVRLRVSETSQGMRVDFTRGFNLWSPVRSMGFQGLWITGQLDTVHRIAALDNGTNTADSGELRVRVNATNIASELFSILNMETFAVGVWRIEEGCVFGALNTTDSAACRTFANNAPPNGGITTTPDQFFKEARKFFWRDDSNNYGSSNPTVLVYDMRRTFTDSTSLAAATPYYAGELVLTVDTTPNIVWMGVTNRTAGAWSQLSGTLV